MQDIELSSGANNKHMVVVVKGRRGLNLVFHELTMSSARHRSVIFKETHVFLSLCVCVCVCELK